MSTCPQCGRENPDGFKFCGSCGAPLVAAEQREVRKTVTVVFCDVTGSTALGEQLDPESLRRVMGRYFDEMRMVVVAHEGTVEKFIGDAVMAVFGIPVLHEDDALRAVRAAEEMREKLGELNEELERDWGVRIQVRTGVNTGEVVAGDASSGQRFATGDTVNVAKRFEEAAPAGEILLGDSTYRLVRDAVEVEPVAPLELKGKVEPISAYRLVKVEAGAPGRARRLDSPMVGRERERAVLHQAYQRAVGERACHLFTVLGAAGVGKSRLVVDFLDELGERATVVSGRCLPYGEGITFWPLLEVIRNLYGEDFLSGLAGRLAGDENAELISERIEAAVGVGDGAGLPDETFWAVRKLFEAHAGERPLVVVFDDLHWAAPTFLDLVEHIADWSRDAPLLLVCLARPEFLDGRPNWGGGKFNATSVLLEPLNEDESAELVGNLLGRTRLAEEVQLRLTDAAEGNPLFVEEMLAMLIDDGLLERSNGDWVPTGDLRTVSVPPTIQALLSARLDRLGPSERAVIERAAVEGKVFHRGAVAELSATEVRSEVGGYLQTLVRKELVRPDRADFPGEDAFRFRHLLIRDAAYDAMPKELRAELHERFAAWLEKAAGDRVVEYEEILGFHLEQAYRYRTELAPADEASAALAGRAAERLSSAAQRALARVDMPATIGLLERSLTLLPEDDSRRARFLCDLGYALRERGALEAAETALKSAITAAEEVGDPVLHALADVRLTAVGTQRGGGGMEDAAAKLEQLTGELERLGDEPALAEAFFIFGQHLSWSGQEASATRALEKAAEMARRLGDTRLESTTLGWIAIDAFWLRVPVEDGLQTCGRELARPGANRLGQSELLIMDGNLKYMAGQKEEGLAEVAAGQALMEELGRDLERHAFRMATGLVLLLAGEFRRAEEELRPGCEALRAMGEAGYLSTAAAELALSLCWQGCHDEAELLVEESKELGAADDLTTQVYWRCALAQVLAARGEHDRAVGLTGEAIELLEQGDRLLDMSLVKLSAADVYRTAGRLDESRSMLEGALELAHQKGNVSGAAWVERLLAES